MHANSLEVWCIWKYSLMWPASYWTSTGAMNTAYFYFWYPEMKNINPSFKTHRAAMWVTSPRKPLLPRFAFLLSVFSENLDSILNIISFFTEQLMCFHVDMSLLSHSKNSRFLFCFPVSKYELYWISTAIYFGQVHLPVILSPRIEWCRSITHISSCSHISWCNFQWLI